MANIISDETIEYVGILAKLELSDEEIKHIRGKDISMIFQEPSAALNPVITIGRQIAESIMLHKGLNKEQALHEAAGLLAKVGIPNPEQRIKEYPHQFSGGMQQRAMIAMARNIPQPNKVAFQKFSLNAFRKSCQRKRGSSSTM